ncbi:hypothetical protein CLV24_14413 [Pontibacter ummariensis]|uniref:Uncharacterized protein n=1 Tax=Pontibacter ummariensis TaxID=1610492 RepID=A0A239LLR4_9BACT|nr:hypothetical protein [Pontibacter ummariensis]PRY02944.1 hypothetical protein CLV24_14413 [Pontibacter ummariensis]SNT31617.1 hypothetical protein SAMN06296052_14513 [Pontibacter ummariensis]
MREEVLRLQKDFTRSIRPLHNQKMNKELQELVKGLEEMSRHYGHRDIEARMNKWIRRFYSFQQDIAVYLIDLQVLRVKD